MLLTTYLDRMNSRLLGSRSDHGHTRYTESISLEMRTINLGLPCEK